MHTDNLRKSGTMIDLEKKKILLVRNDNVGDLICTTPAIEALRKKYPNTQIDIVVNSYNYDAIHKNPFVDTIYCYTKPKHTKKLSEKLKAGLGKLKILFDIRKEKYDAVVVFRTGYSKSAELFASVTGAAHSIGVKNPKGRDRFTMHIPFSGDRHEVEFCYDCLVPFGVEPGKERTRFYIEEGMQKRYDDMKTQIVFHISARMQENKMSYEKLKALLDLLGKPVVITAEPDDFALAEKLAKHTTSRFIQTESFLDLGALVMRAELFITLEGGAMHLAPALGVPTMALFGKSPVERWYPWGYKNLVLQDKSKKAENIENKKIVAKVNEVLNKHSSGVNEDA